MIRPAILSKRYRHCEKPEAVFKRTSMFTYVYPASLRPKEMNWSAAARTFDSFMSGPNDLKVKYYPYVRSRVRTASVCIPRIPSQRWQFTDRSRGGTLRDPWLLSKLRRPYMQPVSQIDQPEDRQRNRGNHVLINL